MAEEKIDKLQNALGVFDELLKTAEESSIIDPDANVVVADFARLAKQSLEKFVAEHDADDMRTQSEWWISFVASVESSG